jgi:hypothetical protein
VNLSCESPEFPTRPGRRNLRAFKIGNCDIDMVYSNNFGHGIALPVEGLMFK